MFDVIFTHHNDFFSKNGRRDYPYGVTLSKIRSKQVLIRLFPVALTEKDNVIFTDHNDDFFKKIIVATILMG